MGNNGWEYYSLSDLTDNFDSIRVPVKEADRKKGQYPYYGASGIIDMVDGYLFEGEYLLVAEDGENLRSRKTPIAFIAKGKFWVNNHAHIVRGNKKGNTRFLMYALKSMDISGYLTGSTLPKLTQDNLNRIPVFAPPLPEQRAIAGILGALDDKIEVNRRMNATLESMARAVFRQWFVENEEAGNWEFGTVIQDFNLTMGQSPPGETYNEDGIGMPFFQGRADFGIRFPSNRVYCTAPTRFANPGDTLVCVRAPVGDLNMASEKCAIGRGVAAIRHKTGSRSYTYYTMHSLEEDFKQFEAGGTVFGSINKTDFQNLKVVIPPSTIVEQFEEICYPIDQMIENNEKESRTLASLRDSLLPKLMRGEVRVKA